jgi:SH3-like domain-containing protein
MFDGSRRVTRILGLLEVMRVDECPFQEAGKPPSATIKDHGLVIRQIQPICKVMLFLPALPGRVRPLVLALLALVGGLLAAPAPVLAQADNPSGLKLPRFVSTRSNPINVRVGPGTKYEVAWNFLVSGVPVEIIQEFDTWRKIRDAEGDEGWVHQSLLVGNRAGYATPLVANGEVAMRASRSEDAPVRARLAPGVRVSISECDGTWCNVSAGQPGERASHSGFVHQEELWGVYPDEEFD